MDENKACKAPAHGLARSESQHSISLTITITTQPGMEEHCGGRPGTRYTGTSDTVY